MRRSKPTSPVRGKSGEPKAAGQGESAPALDGEEPSSVPASGSRPAATDSRFAPRNWRFATKLNAILLIPVLVALALGGFRVHSSYETWQEADDAEQIAELVRASAAYAHALIDERDISAEPLLRGITGGTAVQEARQITDNARTEFWGRVKSAPSDASLDRRLDEVRAVEPHLETLRRAAYTDELPGVETEEGYVSIQRPLMSFANELGLGTGNVTSYGRTVYSISLAKAASSLQRAIGTRLLVAPGPGAEQKAAQLTAFGSFAYLEGIAQSEFAAAGTEQDVQRLERALAATSASVAAGHAPDMETMVEMLLAGGTPEELAKEGITPGTWFETATTEFNAYRTVERELADDAVVETGQIAASARNDVMVNSLAVLSALLLAFFITALMARSMSTNMSRLRGAALEVAEQRLPALVDQLSRTKPGQVDDRVVPILVDSRDEIGEVSRAFDHVHREAVRLASEQALLRGNVNAIFTNLSSRNQGLIERQLDLISELESNEADPNQLQNLFRLDHLATRMRRNGENLLVLAGEEPGSRWNQPIPLIDVLRASASEVEGYERIELSGVPKSEIHGTVVNDLVHLLAELLENAISFSSPQSKIRVTATRLPDGRIMIEIHDKGIGLTAEEFAEINHRLADPPSVDASVSERMGLFVVGRLSERHDIRVQLRPSGEQSGTTSLVMLPEAISQGGGTGQREFAVPRSASPEEHLYITEEQQQAGLRSAAELGFDDSRYADAGSAAGAGRREELRPAWEQRAQSVPAATDGPPGERSTPMKPFSQTAPPFGVAGPSSAPGNPYPGGVQGQQGAGSSQWPVAGAASGSADGPPVRDTGASNQELYQTPLGAGGPPRWDSGWQGPSDGFATSRPVEEPGERGPRREESSGTTPSGLPKRVPRANLAEHSTPSVTEGGGLQVSRDPDDVRGRLSNLHRGVRQGRGAGVRRSRNEQPGDDPGNTYDQER